MAAFKPESEEITDIPIIGQNLTVPADHTMISPTISERTRSASKNPGDMVWRTGTFGEFSHCDANTAICSTELSSTSGIDDCRATMLVFCCYAAHRSAVIDADMSNHRRRRLSSITKSIVDEHPNPPAAAGGAEGDRGGDRGLPESHQRRPRRPRQLPPPHPHPPRLADGGVGRGMSKRSWTERISRHRIPKTSETGYTSRPKQRPMRTISTYQTSVIISEEDHRAIYSRCSVRTGDVLYVKDGANTGIVPPSTR